MGVPAEELQRTAVITYALAEAPAVYGLVLFFLSGSSWDFYAPLAWAPLAWALVLLLLHFPRRSEWETWTRGG